MSQRSGHGAKRWKEEFADCLSMLLVLHPNAQPCYALTAAFSTLTWSPASRCSVSWPRGTTSRSPLWSILPLPTPLCGVHACACQEIIGIMLAVATFADELSNRKVVLYSDNKGTQRVCLGRLCARVPSSFVQAPNTPLRRDLRRRSITTRSSTRSRYLFYACLGFVVACTCIRFGRWCSSATSTFG